MFKKIVLGSVLFSSLLFSMSANMVQTVSKEKLGCIKGLGIKRVTAIVNYRKTHNLKGLEDLLEVRGIGKGLLQNIKEEKQKKRCTKMNTLKEKKIENRKKNISAE